MIERTGKLVMGSFSAPGEVLLLCLINGGKSFTWYEFHNLPQLLWKNLGLQRFEPSEPVWFCLEVHQDILTFTFLFHQNQMKLPRFWTQHPDLCRSFRSLIVRRKCVLYRAKPASSVARPSCIFFHYKTDWVKGKGCFQTVFALEAMKLVCCKGLMDDVLHI